MVYVDRVRRKAVLLSDQGHPKRAAAEIKLALATIAPYTSGDAELVRAMEELQMLAGTSTHQSLESSSSRDLYYRQQLSSRGQRDYRDPTHDE